MHRVLVMFQAAAAIIGLSWIASGYLQPAMRKAILFAGFGLC